MQMKCNLLGMLSIPPSPPPPGGGRRGWEDLCMKRSGILVLRFELNPKGDQSGHELYFRPQKEFHLKRGWVSLLTAKNNGVSSWTNKVRPESLICIPLGGMKSIPDIFIRESPQGSSILVNSRMNLLPNLFNVWSIFLKYPPLIAEEFCWISNARARLLVLGVPVAIILLFNVGALTLTMISIWKVHKVFLEVLLSLSLLLFDSIQLSGVPLGNVVCVSATQHNKFRNRYGR